MIRKSRDWDAANPRIRDWQKRLGFGIPGLQSLLESSRSLQVPPPKQRYSPGGITIFALPAVPLCPLKCNGNENFKVIQDSCRITPKIESLVVYAMPDIPSKFQKDPSTTFRVILLTHRQTNKQTDRQTKTGKNITSLAEVNIYVLKWNHPSQCFMSASGRVFLKMQWPT